MTRTRSRCSGLLLAAGGIAGLCAPAPAFAGDPAVHSVVEGRDASSGRPVVLLLGNDLTRAKSFTLLHAADHSDAGPVSVLVRTKNLYVLALPATLPQGAYEIVLAHKKGTATAAVVVTRGELLPGSVKPEALEDTLKGDLADAATLDGRGPSWFADASNLSTGTLHPSLYSAIDDLALEGRLGTASDQVARGDHDHHGTYFKKSELQDAGMLNASSNPLEWTKLKGVPADLADGDGDTAYLAGTGLSLTGTTFSVPFAGTGTAETSARSDHDHDDRYCTEAELDTPGTVNTSSNPVDWTKLKGVPAGFADEVDADTTYTAGNGLSLSGTVLSAKFGGDGIANLVSRSDHEHAALYYKKTELNVAGIVNEGTNPVEWSKLKGVPPDFADGADADTTYTAGNGLSLSGTVLSAKFGGDGIANLVSRSDHEHAALYYKKTELNVAGTVNDATNPVEWSKLKGVPPEFADGLDATATYTAGSGLTLSSNQFGVDFGATSTTVTRGNDPRLLPEPMFEGGLLYDTGTSWEQLGLGAEGDVLQSVAGAPAWQPGPWSFSGIDVYRSYGRVGIGVTAPEAGLHVVADDGVLFTDTAGGFRMMWLPAYEAFRAGAVDDDAWDEGNIGYRSFAGNYGTRAVGENSTAFGEATLASGYAAFAAGSFSEATGDYATALGAAALAYGESSFAAGVDAWAQGESSTALGEATWASGKASFAAGENGRASGPWSVALGYGGQAAGSDSTALGFSCRASGNASLAAGENTEAQPYDSVALGRFNSIAGNKTSWVATDPVLVVGNGTTSSRSNCFTLLKNGNLTISGTLTQNSDARLKQDIAPLAGVLPKLRAIRGVTYRFKDADRNPGDAQMGLLAQEVRAQFPELVAEDADGKLSIAYGNFNAVLVEAIREQQDQIAARDAEIAALRKDLAAARDGFEKRLARIESQLGR